MDAPPLVEIRSLTVRRGGEAILDAVSLDVAPGSIHALIGPNGGGKTTLLTSLLGLADFAGSIRLQWRGSGRIGYVPQGFRGERTLPLTVADFLALTRQRRPVALGIGRAARERIAGLLDRVGLAGFERRPLGGLSGGEFQRVLLAHALDPAPELLVLDEPAASLDPESDRRVEALLAGLKAASGVTVLLVTHDHAQVRRIADRATILNRRVVREGSPGELKADELQN